MFHQVVFHTMDRARDSNTIDISIQAHGCGNGHHIWDVFARRHEVAALPTAFRVGKLRSKKFSCHPWSGAPKVRWRVRVGALFVRP